MSPLASLRATTKGLLFLSESDSPLKPFLWTGVVIDSEAALRAHLKLDAGLPLTEVPVDAFFAPMTTPQPSDNDQARADQARFSALVALLSTLQSPRVFRVGTGPEIPAYALGTTPEGDSLGVRLLLTET